MSDLYQTVTNKIITALEEGTPPWHKPWTGGNSVIGFPLRSTEEPYQGINILILWLKASKKTFPLHIGLPITNPDFLGVRRVKMKNPLR